MRKKAAVLTVFAAFLMLSGCAGKNREVLSCPETGLMRYADSAIYTDAAGNETGYAEFVDFRGSCRFARRGPEAVLVDLDLTFYAEDRSDAERPPRRKDIEYFVAILSPDDRILVKEVFQIPVTIDRDVRSGMETETVQKRIPLENKRDAGDYQIVLGLQLTPEQLERNRKKGAPRN